MLLVNSAYGWSRNLARSPDGLVCLKIPLLSLSKQRLPKKWLTFYWQSLCLLSFSSVETVLEKRDERSHLTKQGDRGYLE
ncbi:hypothetical protein AB3R30_15690 [Leptolyngbyaceae cyanobacterium UHCC 1019]